MVKVRLARAGPDDGGIRLEHRDGPDRLDSLRVEHGLPRGAAVDRLPDAAAGAPHIEDVGIGLDAFDRRHPAARASRADGAHGEPGEAGRIDAKVRGQAGDGDEESEDAEDD
jgi:hypothetical protein